MAIVNPPGWQQSRSDHPARLYRRVLSALLTSSSEGGTAGPNQLVVTPGSGMSVSVSAGDAFVLSSSGTRPGHYHVVNDGAETVTLGAANATNPRRDLIALRIRDDEYGHSTADAGLVVVAGTPAASPVDPVMPTDGFYLVLARVSVPANASALTTGNITQLANVAPRAGLRVGNRANVPASSGAGQLLLDGSTPFFSNGSAWRSLIQPVIVTSTTRPSGSDAFAGMTIWETDTQRGYVWDGAAWELVSGRPHCHVYRATYLPLANGWNPGINWDGELDPSAMHAPNAAAITSKLTGLYRVSYQITVTGVPPGARLIGQINVNSNVPESNPKIMSTATGPNPSYPTSTSATADLQLAADDYVTLSIFAEGSSPQLTLARMTVEWARNWSW